MMLLTKEILERFEQVGEQDVADPIVVTKFFNPTGGQTWLAIAYNPKERLFFGYVSLFNDPSCNELGYFGLDELESVKGMFGLGIERDRGFRENVLSEVKKSEHIY